MLVLLVWATTRSQAKPFAGQTVFVCFAKNHVVKLALQKGGGIVSKEKNGVVSAFSATDAQRTMTSAVGSG